jgi:ABC-2 type transport system permease protein
MRTLFHIVWYKALSFFKTTTQLKVASIAKSIASLFVFGGFALGAYFFTFNTIQYIMEVADLGSFLLHRFLSMLLYVFFLSINIGNIIVSYATLYRSKETEFFFTKPVPHLSLFIIKFLDNFFYSSTTLFMIALAVLFGYGQYFQLPWTFYVNTLVFLFLPFMLIAASLGVTALMLLMKVAGKIGTKATLISLVVAYVGVVIAYFKLINPAKLVNGVMKHFPYTDQYFGYLDPPASTFLPNHWMTEALYWNLKGETASVVSNTALLILVSAACVSLMFFIARKLYYKSWLSYLELKAHSETHATANGFFSFAKKSMFEPQTAVLIKKEFWQFFREPSQWIHLAIILLLIVVFVASIFQLTLGTNQPYLQTVSYLVMYVFNAFLVTSVALRFVYPMMSTEGMSFWKVRSAPIQLNKVYWLKFLLAVIPVLIANELLMIASHHAIAHHQMIVLMGLMTSVFVALSIISMNLGTGTFFADYRETNPIKISSSQGATLTFLMSIAYLVFLIAMLFFPLFGYFQMAYKHIPYSSAMFFVSIGVFLLGSAIVMFISHTVGLKAIKRDF